MSTPVFSSDGLVWEPGRMPPVVVEGNHVQHWPTPGGHIAELALDAVMGLAPAGPRGAIWFGEDFATLRPPERLRVLSRLAPLTRHGDLLANINLCENILLTLLERRAASAAELEHRLAGLLGAPPWDRWFPAPTLGRLPHQLDEAQRFLAGVLRAAISEPEAIVVCHPFARLEPAERRTAEDALVWLRTRLPACPWLFITPESGLPRSLAVPTIGDERP